MKKVILMLVIVFSAVSVQAQLSHTANKKAHKYERKNKPRTDVIGVIYYQNGIQYSACISVTWYWDCTGPVCWVHVIGTPPLLPPSSCPSGTPIYSGGWRTGEYEPSFSEQAVWVILDNPSLFPNEDFNLKKK